MAESVKMRRKQKQETPTRSRAKTLQVACSLCRRRKTRCNGGRPSCETCVVKGEACVYDTLENESRPEAMRRENVALQIRISRLEAEQMGTAGPTVSPGHTLDTPSESDLNLDSVVPAPPGALPADYTNARGEDLLHAMATGSDQDASMLLAKLRSGYSWEGLAEEVRRDWQSVNDQSAENLTRLASNASADNLAQQLPDDLPPTGLQRTFS